MKSLNTNITQIFGKVLPLGLLVVGVSSCSVSQNTAREADGIYYDPSTEPAQEKVIVVEDIQRQTEEPVYQYKEPVEDQTIRIGGKYFDDTGNAPEPTETNAYKESEAYNDDRIVLQNNHNYDSWGEDEGVEINVNNYYGGFGPSFYYGSYWNSYRFNNWYGPRWRFGWNSGWGNNPFFSYNYGWGNPYYGFGGYYGNFTPYYYGYGYGFHPYHNNFYGNPYYNGYYRNGYTRTVHRGRGNNNGVRINNNAIQRNRRNVRTAPSPQPRRSTVRPRSSRPRRGSVSNPRTNSAPRATPRGQSRPRRSNHIQQPKKRGKSTHYSSPRRNNNTRPNNSYSSPRRNNSTRSNNSFSSPRSSRSSGSFGGSRSSSSPRRSRR